MNAGDNYNRPKVKRFLAKISKRVFKDWDDYISNAASFCSNVKWSKKMWLYAGKSYKILGLE
ncbi:MAG: hypothetical protein A3E60_03015 [Candidatus Kerfeldbacteria bacterium RIFCSPHIGHO2_12_FULL_42_13]|nr:MAG: hypothetical protein A3E60_03015 [Candidatus Kerfeldbacteria bacterium RIFCSPHIGHO2_12_FULL_42_13]